LEYVLFNFCLFSGNSGDKDELSIGDIVRTTCLRSTAIAMITGFTTNGQFIVMYMDGKSTSKSGSDFKLELPISLLEQMEACDIDAKRKETYNKLTKDEECNVENSHYLVTEYSILTVEHNKR